MPPKRGRKKQTTKNTTPKKSPVKRTPVAISFDEKANVNTESITAFTPPLRRGQPRKCAVRKGTLSEESEAKQKVSSDVDNSGCSVLINKTRARARNKDTGKDNCRIQGRGPIIDRTSYNCLAGSHGANQKRSTTQSPGTAQKQDKTKSRGTTQKRSASESPRTIQQHGTTRKRVATQKQNTTKSNATLERPLLTQNNVTSQDHGPAENQVTTDPVPTHIEAQSCGPVRGETKIIDIAQVYGIQESVIKLEHLDFDKRQLVKKSPKTKKTSCKSCVNGKERKVCEPAVAQCKTFTKKALPECMKETKQEKNHQTESRCTKTESVEAHFGRDYLADITGEEDFEPDYDEDLHVQDVVDNSIEKLSIGSEHISASGAKNQTEVKDSVPRKGSGNQNLEIVSARLVIGENVEFRQNEVDIQRQKLDEIGHVAVKHCSSGGTELEQDNSSISSEMMDNGISVKTESTICDSVTCITNKERNVVPDTGKVSAEKSETGLFRKETMNSKEVFEEKDGSEQVSSCTGKATCESEESTYGRFQKTGSERAHSQYGPPAGTDDKELGSKSLPVSERTCTVKLPVWFDKVVSESNLWNKNKIKDSTIDSGNNEWDEQRKHMDGTKERNEKEVKVTDSGQLSGGKGIAATGGCKKSTCVLIKGSVNKASNTNVSRNGCSQLNKGLRPLMQIETKPSRELIEKCFFDSVESPFMNCEPSHSFSDTVNTQRKKAVVKALSRRIAAGDTHLSTQKPIGQETRRKLKSKIYKQVTGSGVKSKNNNNNDFGYNPPSSTAGYSDQITAKSFDDYHVQPKCDDQDQVLSFVQSSGDGLECNKAEQNDDHLEENYDSELFDVGFDIELDTDVDILKDCVDNGGNDVENSYSWHIHRGTNTGQGLYEEEVIRERVKNSAGCPISMSFRTIAIQTCAGLQKRDTSKSQSSELSRAGSPFDGTADTQKISRDESHSSTTQAIRRPWKRQFDVASQKVQEYCGKRRKKIVLKRTKLQTSFDHREVLGNVPSSSEECQSKISQDENDNSSIGDEEVVLQSVISHNPIFSPQHKRCSVKETSVGSKEKNSSISLQSEHEQCHEQDYVCLEAKLEGQDIGTAKPTSTNKAIEDRHSTSSNYSVVHPKVCRADETMGFKIERRQSCSGMTEGQGEHPHHSSYNSSNEAESSRQLTGCIGGSSQKWLVSGGSSKEQLTVSPDRPVGQWATSPALSDQQRKKSNQRSSRQWVEHSESSVLDETQGTSSNSWCFERGKVTISSFSAFRHSSTDSVMLPQLGKDHTTASRKGYINKHQMPRGMIQKYDVLLPSELDCEQTATLPESRIMIEKCGLEGKWEKLARMLSQLVSLSEKQEIQPCLQHFTSALMNGAKYEMNFIKFLQALESKRNGVLENNEKHYIGTIGLMLMTRCLTQKNIQTAFMVLFLLHQKAIPYMYPSLPFIVPTAKVVLTAAEICLAVGKPEQIFEIMKMTKWFEKSSATKSPETVIHIRVDAVRDLLLRLLRAAKSNQIIADCCSGVISVIASCVKKLAIKYKTDQCFYRQYTKYLDFSILFRELLPLAKEHQHKMLYRAIIKTAITVHSINLHPREVREILHFFYGVSQSESDYYEDAFMAMKYGCSIDIYPHTKYNARTGGIVVLWIVMSREEMHVAMDSYLNSICVTWLNLGIAKAQAGLRLSVQLSDIHPTTNIREAYSHEIGLNIARKDAIDKAMTVFKQDMKPPLEWTEYTNGIFKISATSLFNVIQAKLMQKREENRLKATPEGFRDVGKKRPTKSMIKRDQELTNHLWQSINIGNDVDLEPSVGQQNVSLASASAITDPTDCQLQNEQEIDQSDESAFGENTLQKLSECRGESLSKRMKHIFQLFGSSQKQDKASDNAHSSLDSGEVLADHHHDAGYSQLQWDQSLHHQHQPQVDFSSDLGVDSRVSGEPCVGVAWDCGFRRQKRGQQSDDDFHNTDMEADRRMNSKKSASHIQDINVAQCSPLLSDIMIQNVCGDEPQAGVLSSAFDAPYMDTSSIMQQRPDQHHSDTMQYRDVSVENAQHEHSSQCMELDNYYSSTLDYPHAAASRSNRCSQSPIPQMESDVQYDHSPLLERPLEELNWPTAKLPHEKPFLLPDPCMDEYETPSSSSHLPFTSSSLIDEATCQPTFHQRPLLPDPYVDEQYGGMMSQHPLRPHGMPGGNRRFSRRPYPRSRQSCRY